ncbi:MAG TPA: Spy/CpxP family protein refolding chaperone [Candidatus Acidoferrales bacterium]|nr:Spy/CpxP family protein refolding chaperone [Candidatus Acidoferrales bacterium]
MHSHFVPVRWHGGRCGPEHEHHAHCGCGPGSRGFDRTGHHHFGGEDFAGGFGVRRPLRFLAWKLGLSESQVTEFAAVINELKTERAQSAVDDRRALTLFADAAAGESFDAAKAGEAARLRASSEERLQKKVADSLARMHALLEPEQRLRLATLLRTGVLAM